MRALVTGAGGMLGFALRQGCPEEVEFFGTDQEVDIRDARAVSSSLDAHRPDVVINAAAYTDVDGCEDHEEEAMSVNGVGAGVIAEACAKAEIPILQVSTDYVFDGFITTPGEYGPEDQVSPLSAYGRTKLEGERRVAKANPAHWIVRTQWLYGCHGKNFVETMLSLAESNEEVSVVDDQEGSPTLTHDLAMTLWKIVLRQPSFGTYHARNSGSCSWHEFAVEVFRLAGVQMCVHPTKTASLGRPAPRPARSVLECSKLQDALGLTMASWEDALARYLSLRSDGGGTVSGGES